MAFWSDSNLEPKRSYRWIAIIDYKVPTTRGGSTSLGLKTSPFLVKNFTRPKLILEHDRVINSDTNLTRYTLRNAEWEPIAISLVDFQNREFNSTNNTWTWLTDNGYNSKAFASLTGDDLTNFFSQMNNLQGLGGGLATLKLLHIDETGNDFESWEFLDPRLLEIAFGDQATYEADGLLTVDIRFNIAAAEYKSEDSDLIGGRPPIVTAANDERLQSGPELNLTPPRATQSLIRDV